MGGSGGKFNGSCVGFVFVKPKTNIIQKIKDAMQSRLFLPSMDAIF